MADERTEKQKVQEITDKLEEGLKELFESEKYKTYLSTMSKFHNYSFNNTLLIAMQKPVATLVAGYKAWQKNFERHVNKGEKAIRILAPAPYKIKEERDKLDPVTGEMTAAFLIVCATGGENVNWGYLGFEVLFPFYMAIAIGEWCRTRSDQMFDVISAQGKSLFLWIVRRFLLLFVAVTVFAVMGMFATFIITKTFMTEDLLLTFLPTAFFLSSVCVFLSLLSSVPHIPTMAVGVIWLFSIMSMSLLRFQPVQYFYLFVRFAGIDNSVWIVNKMILLLIGIALWLGVFIICKKRLWNKL